MGLFSRSRYHRFDRFDKKKMGISTTILLILISNALLIDLQNTHIEYGYKNSALRFLVQKGAHIMGTTSDEEKELFDAQSLFNNAQKKLREADSLYFNGIKDRASNKINEALIIVENIKGLEIVKNQAQITQSFQKDLNVLLKMINNKKLIFQ